MLRQVDYRSRFRGIGRLGRGSAPVDPLSFKAPLVNDLSLLKGVGSATFSRASSRTIKQWDDSIVTISSNVSGFTGARLINDDKGFSKYQPVANDAMSFNGTDDWIDIGTTAGEFDGNKGSISFWIRRYWFVGDGTNYAFYFRADGNNQIYNFRHDSANYWRVVHEGSNTIKSLDLGILDDPVGYWTHIVYTWDTVADELNAYVNGVASGNNPVSGLGTFSGTLTDASIGTRYDAVVGFVRGDMNEVRIYADRVLTQTEVTNLYNNVDVGDTGLIAYYKLNDSDTSITDYSGNDNTGTSANTPTLTGSHYDSASEIADATLLGYRVEPQVTNICLRSEQFDNAAWVATNVTKTADQDTGPEGTLTADELSATAGNGTVLQTITAGNADYIFSVWLKRKTGTGDVDITVDGGTTWETKTLTSSYQRFETAEQTVTNPQVGIRIVTSGDEVYAWGGMVETGKILHDYIKTVGASVTKLADDLSYPNTNNQNLTNEFSLVLSATPSGDGTDYATTAWRLFGTDDTGGTVDEMATLGHAATYSYSAGTGGGELIQDQGDFSKDTRYKLGFSVDQQGSNAITNQWLDATQKVTDESDAQTLGHSDTSIEIGYWGSTYFSGWIRDVKIWKKILSGAELQTETT